MTFFTKSRVLRTIFIVCAVSLLATLNYVTNTRSRSRLWTDDESIFAKIDNETGADTYIVPNILHYIRWEKRSFSFVDYVCVRSAYLNHKPDRIYFHTNLDNFTGKYWKKLLQDPDFRVRTEVKYLKIPTEIYGQKLSEGWRLYHGSDIGRIGILREYGGIYLDNDVYVVRSLNEYRKYEIAIGWDEGQYIGTQIIIAHRKARFLKLWLETYQVYKSELWYYNAGERPTQEVLYKQPELVHRVKLKFGVHMLSPSLYETYWKDWREQDSIHLLMSHRSYLDSHFKEYPEFTEKNIVSYNYTFGEMAREVM